MIRIVLTKPKRKHQPVTGLVYYVDGMIVGQAEIQERPNKTSKWKPVDIIKQEDLKDGH